MVQFGVLIFTLTVLTQKVIFKIYSGEELVEAKKKAKDEIFFIIDQIKKNKYSLILLK
jgi:hypothetical protein